MKKDEMIEYLKKQSEEIKKELENLQESFNIRKEKLIRIDGALEALAALEPDMPPVPEPDIPRPPDHSDALNALASAGM
jgi:dynactin complex subunit